MCFTEMGKDKGGFLSPKQIANRIKAKGLQKLRWYCQMCQKQCRDEVKQLYKYVHSQKCLIENTQSSVCCLPFTRTAAIVNVM